MTARRQSSKVSYHSSSTRSQCVLHAAIRRHGIRAPPARDVPHLVDDLVAEEADEPGLRGDLGACTRRNQSSPSSLGDPLRVAQQDQPADTDLLQRQEVAGEEVLGGLGPNERSGYPGPQLRRGEAHVVLGARLGQFAPPALGHPPVVETVGLGVGGGRHGQIALEPGEPGAVAAHDLGSVIPVVPPLHRGDVVHRDVVKSKAAQHGHLFCSPRPGPRAAWTIARRTPPGCRSCPGRTRIACRRAGPRPRRRPRPWLSGAPSAPGCRRPRRPRA